MQPYGCEKLAQGFLQGFNQGYYSLHVDVFSHVPDIPVREPLPV